MKRNPIAFICGIISLAVSNVQASDQGSSLPTLIVAPFSGDTTAIQYWQPALGQGLSEMFVTELGKINKFTVLENSQLG